MPATLIADRPNEYEIYFSRLMLDHAIDEVHLADFAQLRPVPKNNGNNSVRFFRIPVASAANVQAVTEGVLVATSRKMVFEFVTVGLSQFYDWVQITDLVNDTEFNDTGEAVSTQFGEECALWYDQKIRDLCCAAAGGLSQYFVGGAANLGALDAITNTSAALQIRNLLASATILRNNKAPKIKTGPARGSYAAVVSPQGQFDLFVDTNNTAFVQADAFGNNGKNIRAGWIDNLYGLGFFLTTNPFIESNSSGLGVYNSGGTQNLAAGAQIFSAIVTGKDSYGASALQGNTPWSPRVMVNGKPDKYDIIGQFINFSWKAYAGWVVLNPNFGNVIRHKSQWKQ